MKMESLDVFIVHSPITAIIMAYWREEQQQRNASMMVTDSLPLKSSQAELMTQIATTFAFDRIIRTHTEIEEETSFMPSVRKKVMRRLKTVQGFKQVYFFFFNMKEKRAMKVILENSLQQLGIPDGVQNLNIYCCPQCILLPAIQLKFPHAKVAYFEHGLGDYFDVENRIVEKTPFYCVLNEGYTKYLKSKGIATDVVRPAIGQNRFSQTAIGKPPQELTNFLQTHDDKEGVLLIMQSLENYDVPYIFWERFIDQALERFEQNQDYFIILKLHPYQNPETVPSLIQFFDQKDIPVFICKDPATQNLSVELLFTHIADHIHYVMSPFSSSTLYIRKLFPNHNIRYFWGIDLVLEHANKAAPIYRERWRAVRDELLPYFGEGIEKI